MKVVRLSALRTGRLYPQEILLVLISVRDWVGPMAIVWPEGLCQRKIPKTPQGIKPATFGNLTVLCINRAILLDTSISLRYMTPFSVRWCVILLLLLSEFLYQVSIGLLKLRQEVLWMMSLGLFTLCLRSALAAPINFNQPKELLASEGSDAIIIHVHRTDRKRGRECRAIPCGGRNVSSVGRVSSFGNSFRSPRYNSRALCSRVPVPVAARSNA
jgi:hypothetical protein